MEDRNLAPFGLGTYP